MTLTMDISQAVHIEDDVLVGLGCDSVHLGRVEDDGRVEVDIHLVEETPATIRAVRDYLASI